MECTHVSTRTEEVKKTVGRQVFSTIAQVCTVCGAARWDADAGARFDAWLMHLACHKSDCFTIQEVKIPTNVVAFLNQKSREFSGKENKSAMIKAMVSVWCNVVDKNSVLADAVEKEYNSNCSILDHREIKENVRFNPKFYMRVKALAELSEMSMQEFIAACVARVSLAIMNEEEMSFYDIRIRIREILEAA
jgi:hypothetical protein